MFRIEGNVATDEPIDFGRDYQLTLAACGNNPKAEEHVMRMRFNKRQSYDGHNLGRVSLLRKDPVYRVLRHAGRRKGLSSAEKLFLTNLASERVRSLLMAEHPYTLIREAKEDLAKPDPLYPRYPLGA